MAQIERDKSQDELIHKQIMNNQRTFDLNQKKEEEKKAHRLNATNDFNHKNLQYKYVKTLLLYFEYLCMIILVFKISL